MQITVVTATNLFTIPTTTTQLTRENSCLIHILEFHLGFSTMKSRGNVLEATQYF